MVKPSARGRIRPLPEGASSTGTVDGDDIDWPTNSLPGGSSLTVEDSGASPSVAGVTTIIFDDAGFLVVDNLDGSVTIEAIPGPDLAYSPVSVTDDDGDHYYLLCDGDGTPVLVEV